VPWRINQGLNPQGQSQGPKFVLEDISRPRTKAKEDNNTETHVAALLLNEAEPGSDMLTMDSEVLEIGWTFAVDTIKSSGCHLELSPLKYNTVHAASGRTSQRTWVMRSTLPAPAGS